MQGGTWTCFRNEGMQQSQDTWGLEDFLKGNGRLNEARCRGKALYTFCSLHSPDSLPPQSTSIWLEVP